MSSFIKNVVFLGVIVLGIAVLWLMCATQGSIAAPNSFRPESDVQSNIRDIAAQVDAAFEKDWEKKDISPADVATDLNVARRLSLALNGTIPSVQEIRALEAIDPSQRVHYWVSRLLEDRSSADYLAERFARAFVGVDQGPFLLFRRRRFVDWLSKELAANRPYDQLVRQLLSDDGIWTDSPAVNFYTRNVIADSGKEDKPDPVLLAGRTSRAFLATRIDCVQCHDDFVDGIYVGDPEDPRNAEQTDFHHLAAFFGGTRNSFFGIRDIENTKASWKYQLLHDDEETQIPAQVPWQPELQPDTGPLRDQLAAWVTHPENRPFARSAINRVWAIMTGKPLVDPVDSIPLAGPFPAAMEVLADDFIENGFDLQRLIKVIAETRAFRLQSSSPSQVTQRQYDANAVFPLTRMRPDQMAGAVIQASSLSTINADSHVIDRIVKFTEQNQFVSRYGDPGENEFEERGETVTQKLLMFNGEMINRRISDGIMSSAHIADLAPDTESAIETVFLATLTRRPTDVEMKWFKDRFAERKSLPDSVNDLYWSLINSLEFGWNH